MRAVTPEHENSEEGNFMDNGHPMEKSTTSVESPEFFTGEDELSSSSAKDAFGCASLPSDPAPLASEYFSALIQCMLESRSEFGSNLEAEIDASKGHWPELQAGSDGEGSAKANLEVFLSLQPQYGGPDGFSQDWSNTDGWYEVGEKIAEGTQAEI